MKKYKILGHIYFAALFFFAIFYYKERVIFVDSAAQIFEIINSGWFIIYVERFSMIFSQILPIIAVKLNLPLKYVLIIYSSSFILLAYIAYLISVYKFKNIHAGIIIILVIIGVRHTFFHAISETFQALAFSSLIFAYLYYPKKDNKILNQIIFYAILLSLILLNYFIHPVTFFTVLFVFGYYIVDKNKWKDYRIYAIVAFVVVLFVSKAFFGGSAAHDTGFFSEFKNIKEILPNFWHTYTIKYPIRFFSKIYIYPSIMFVIVTVFFILKKQYLKIAYIIFSILGFLFISLIIYNKGDYDIGMERTFLPLVFFISIPFVQTISLYKSKIIDYSLFIFIIISLGISFYGINNVSQIYTNRINYIDKLISDKNSDSRKFVITDEIINHDLVKANWCLAIESLLYSSLSSPDSAVTFFYQKNIKSLLDLEKTDEIFYATPWGMNWHSNTLNEKYYNLPTQKYALYSYSPLIYFCGAEFLNQDSMFISEKDSLITFAAGVRQSNEQAFEGEYSLKLDNKNPYGFSITIENVETYNNYKIEVMYFGNSKSFITAKAQNIEDFYINNGTFPSNDTLKWQKLSLSFQIKEKISDKKLIIFVSNNNNEPVYFDNFKISIIK